MKKNQNLSIDRIIKIASDTAAKTAIEHMEKQREEEKKNEKDRRLRNTKLLLRHYKALMAHCGEYKIDESEEIAEDVLRLLDAEEEELIVESIKKSKLRTKIIIDHINKMLEIYKLYCLKSERPEDARRYRVINCSYIEDNLLTVEEIADIEMVEDRTIYRDLKEAQNMLSALFFGIDGFKTF